MKFRKKPVIIEAEQFREKEQFPLPFADRWACNYDGENWYVITAHGQKTIIVDGDWIIPEPDNRCFYPCKPDIFEATYELVNP